MTMRRRRMWRFVGGSGIAVACISLVFFVGMGGRTTLGFERKGVVTLSAGSGFVSVGISKLSVYDGWFWERGGLPLFRFLPDFYNGVVRIPVIYFALLGAVFGLVGWKRGRRKPDGFCTICLYDLTGNDSGICPECGTAITPDKVP